VAGQHHHVEIFSARRHDGSRPERRTDARPPYRAEQQPNAELSWNTGGREASEAACVQSLTEPAAVAKFVCKRGMNGTAP